jgi:hypothetical protein
MAVGQPSYTSIGQLRDGLACFRWGLGSRAASGNLTAIDVNALSATNEHAQGNWHWVVWNVGRQTILDPKNPPYTLRGLRTFSYYPLLKL